MYQLPRNVVKYNNTLGKKLNKGKLNTILFHLELKQCLYFKNQMKKDYLNYDYFNIAIKRLESGESV